MNDKEKEFIRNINVDKARKMVKIPIIITIISLITYIVPLSLGNFDFGMIFEIITIALIFIAVKYMNRYDETHSKKYITLAMLPIGWLLIYDLIIMLSYVSNIIDLAFLIPYYIWGEILIILELVILFKINRDLSKADNPDKYKDSIDWFYEKYEEKKDVGGNKNV